MQAFPAPLLLAALVAAGSPAAAATAVHPAAAHAPAKSEGVSSDVRCLLTMALLSQDKARQQPALIGSYFFAGRISARAPGLDLPAAVKAEEAKFTKNDLQPELTRCGGMIQAAAASLRNSFAGPGGPPPAAPGAAPAPAPAPLAPPPAAAPPK
ncbi:MAG TPA: hypothetical protein VNW53_13110 [Phenylobacterium sp.]|jgi:hypothetical protein|uniref:hypothetical protein n=1 Tax=Phenylobacterium sp. TaxID=1871053 RepID=UPI002B919771|nr:hypothetical protein [Phenylobacterium sp.]HXA39932.1 hypothetical protein [Phenylobacterium sp.]